MKKRKPDPTITRAPKDRDNPYKAVRRATFEDEELSWDARGVLAYLLVKPDNWEIQASDLIAASPGGRDKVYRILAELEEHGYLERHTEKTDDGKFGGVRYHLYESPLRENPDTVNPHTEKPYPGKPLPENPEHTNKEDLLSKKKALSKKTEREHPQGMDDLFDFDDNAPVLSQKTLLDRAKLIKGKIPAGQGETPAEVFFEIHPYSAPLYDAVTEDLVTQSVSDLDRWREAVRFWKLEGYKPGNINGQLEWYQTGKRSNRESYQNGANNGTHRRSNGFAGSRQEREPAPEPEFVADKKFLAQMERVNAIRNGRAVAEWAADELCNL